MTVIVIESIGFSATHSISDMLRMNGENYVSHGSKNFIKNTKMGIDDLPFEKFHKQMLTQNGKYENCISVHSNYAPEEIAKLIDGTDTQFFGLMRKSQLKQIMSCFYWAVNEFLNGREDFTLILSTIQNKQGNLLKQIGLPVNMNTCLMLYAFNNVAKFNLSLIKFAHKIFFMEDIIANPARFRELIGISTDSKIDLKVGMGPSHANKAKEYTFLYNAEEILEKISIHGRVNFGDESYTIQDIQQLSLNKSNFD